MNLDPQSNEFGDFRENRRVSRTRAILALGVAGLSDLVSAFEGMTPFQVVVDLATAGLLFVVLGWRWRLLPALFAEALPVTSVFPTWLLVVAWIVHSSKPVVASTGDPASSSPPPPPLLPPPPALPPPAPPVLPPGSEMEK